MIDKWIAEYIGLLIDEEDDKKVEGGGNLSSSKHIASCSLCNTATCDRAAISNTQALTSGLLSTLAC